MKIGFTCGAFDLCHAGHVLMFKECREQCDNLIVAVQSDPSIDRPSKNRPIQTLQERIIQVKAIKYIDQVLVYTTEEDLLELLKNLMPDVRFVGADWEGKHFTGKELPIPVVFNSRNHGYSSSELRKRISEASK